MAKITLPASEWSEQIYTGEQLKQMPDEPIGYQVETLVPKQGRVLIVAKAKRAKSTFAQQLALAIVTGKEFLGFGCEKGTVLYLDLEGMSVKAIWVHRTKRIATQYTGNLSNFILVSKPEHLLIDTDAGKKELEGLIQQFLPDVVIIDSKRYSMKGKEFDAEATLAWAKPIDELRNKYGTTFVIAQHATKKEYKELIDRASGSSAQAGVVDVLLGIREGSDKYHRVMDITTRLEEEPEPLNLEFRGLFALSPEEQQIKAIKRQQAEEAFRLKQKLGLKPTALVREIAKEIGISEAYAWRVYGLLYKTAS